MLALLISFLTIAATLGAKPLWFAANEARSQMMSPADAWDIAAMAFVFLVTAIFWCATWRTRAQKVPVRIRRRR
jgi:hypothetical protein